MLPSVSIIIPAHNAADTLPATLESVLQQTSPCWEAIIVENGSADATAAVAAEWAARDPRIRVGTSARGVGMARNTGLSLARHPWILFLDADDWILPSHLERLTRHLEENPLLDAAHCGWRRIAPDGTIINEEFGPTEVDLFPRFARTCAITIHSCITRRTLIDAVGRFDVTLRTCEDWDLWQRLARSGCRFGAVREVLACYRARAGSASMNAIQLVNDSRQVLARGHGLDPRVTAPRPEYVSGLRASFAENLLYTISWAAGLALGHGQDATNLLDLADPAPGTPLDPSGIAGCIFCCGMLPLALPTSAWADRFEAIDPRLRAFLDKLEAHVGQKGLSRSTQAHLARMAMDCATRARPFTVGRVHAIQVEVTAPIPDLNFSTEVERIHCIITAKGEKLGVIELAAFDGALPAAMLADAIAAEFAWPILERYFTHSVYPSLSASKSAEGWAVVRGDLTLGERIAGNGKISWAEAHDHIGWTVFLQELWSAPELEMGDFYYAAPDSALPTPFKNVPISAPMFSVEVSDSWPDAWTVPAGATAVLTVAGAAVAQTVPAAKGGLVTARALRAAFNSAGAFELCCACVREGILGVPFADPTPLRERLRARAAFRRSRLQSLAVPGGVQLLPETTAFITECAGDASRVVALPRRPGVSGTSVSRRAVLPRVLLPEIAASLPPSEPLLRASGPSADPMQVVYLPDLVWQPESTSVSARRRISAGTDAAMENYFGPDFFERLFQEKPNPWLYTAAYEQKKYEQTLEVLPRARFHRVLELACAEGHFTRQLAPRADHLLATDISPTALKRAAARCENFKHVEFAELDLFSERIPGRFDLIVCSEVLYYAGTIERLRAVAARIARALEPGGCFVTAHAHLVVDEPHRAGFDWDLPYGAKRISEVFSATAPLRLIKDLRTPLYRIQVFQRPSPLRRWLRPSRPQKILLPQPTELPPHAAAHALWRGGAPQKEQSPSAVTTAELPILMYHHIAPAKPGEEPRYRVTPEAFEAQLQWLRSRGYRCVSLNEWREASRARRPLPGRCVALTFDDGYRDFLEHAWPILQRHGFQATVFLPTDHIGGSNVWDRPHAVERPLLTWEEILQLHNDGIEFGSHSAQHPALTSLSPTDVAREALRSRLALEARLQTPITSIAYPYGEFDRVVEQVMGACGYVYGLTCADRRSHFRDRLLALPRIEVRGEMTLTQFEAAVTSG